VSDASSPDCSPNLGASKPATRPDHVPRAIAYIIGATFMFAISSAVSKWLVAIYPIGEVLFTRSAVSLVAFSLVILPQVGLAAFRTKRLRHHVMRSISQSCSQTFLLIAFSLMPLAGAVAINFSAPLFMVLISIVVLKERVVPSRAIALIVGFLGVLIVTSPGAETFQVGAVFALLNAILYASVTVAVRGMTRTESTETLTTYQLVLLTTIFALALPFDAAMPNASDAALMLFNGLTNAAGQYWWTKSLYLAPTSAIAPFQYLSLVWALVIGFIVWGDAPTAALLAGSAVVVGSGLFLLWREATR
jgi:drug/metabolite transporter (DMT)-like permease